MVDRGGHGDNIEGIPLPGSNDIPQVKGSAEPNRQEPRGAFDPMAGDTVEYAEDYFDAVQASEDANAPYVANKDDNQWSVGLEDEENDYGEDNFAELEDESSDGVFAETQPLHVQGSVIEQPDEELPDIELRPDNIQHGSE